MIPNVGAEKAHAKFSASASDRWLSCAGSIQLTEKAPVQSGESKYAKEGTDAHSALEYLVKNRSKRLAAIDFLRKKYPYQMIAHAESALNYIESRLKDLPGAELHAEIKAELPVSEPGQFGTTDIVIVDHFGRLIVIDYKYGAGIMVEPEENSQLIYYALGVAHRYDYNFKDVELVIVQPRAPYGSPIKSWVTTVENLLAWREKFEAGIKLAKSKNPPLLSGDHCRFCPAKVICPEIKNKALRAAQADFMEDEKTMSIEVPKKIEATALTPEKLATVLPALDKLETWISAVREYATDVLENGGEIPGYGLVEKRAQRKWADPEKVEKKAERIFGELAFTKPELLSPAQLEKLGDVARPFVEENTVLVSSGMKLERVKEAMKEVKTNEVTKAKSDESRKSRKSRK